jgi:hypothetical protein
VYPVPCSPWSHRGGMGDSRGEQVAWGSGHAVGECLSPGPWSKAGKRGEPDSPGPWAEALSTVKRSKGAGAAKLLDPPSPGPWPKPPSQNFDLSFAAGSAESMLRDVSRATSTSSRAFNKWEREGRDPLEARRRLDSAGHHCRCGKTRRGDSAMGCCAGLAQASLAAVRAAFWSLSADERAHLVRTMYHTAAGFGESVWGSSAFRGTGSESHAATKWHICGKRICFQVFCHLMGTSASTVLKMVHGVPDRRAHAMKGTSKATECVDFFFYETYLSAAEPLPSAPDERRRSGP